MDLSQRLQRDGLTDEQSAFLIAESGLTAEELTASYARIDRGELGQRMEATKSAALHATLTADEVMTRLQVGPATLHRMNGDGRLHAVQIEGATRYPTWQFTDEPARPLVPGISTVVASFPSGWALASVVGFMATPQEELELDGVQQTPVQWLFQGGEPERVALILDSISWR